jgi:hypothetical protein
MKQMWMETLGKRMDKVINQYKYPPLTPDVFTPEVCVKWRAILSGLPNSEESLKQLLTHRLLKSTIEEIEDMDDHLIFHLSMVHKGERYSVRLKLKDLTWSIVSIQFVDQARHTRLLRGISLSIAFILLLCAGFLVQKWLDKPSIEQAINTDNEENITQFSDTWDETMFTTHLNEIEATAKDHGYILMREDAFEQEIERRITEALPETIPEEPKASEENNKPVKITIKLGSSTSDVVKLLAEKNVVRSEQEALQLLKALGLENKIRAGTYSIPKEATYMEIFNMITK